MNPIHLGGAVRAIAIFLGTVSVVGCSGSQGFNPKASPDSTPSKKITITTPTQSQQIQVQQVAGTKACNFLVSGTSDGIYAERKAQIYVLVHPVNPFSGDWYVQPMPTIKTNGDWSGLSWIGNKEFGPQIGDEIEIVTVATADKQLAERGRVSNPRDIDATAQSSVVTVSIGSIKPSR